MPQPGARPATARRTATSRNVPSSERGPQQAQDAARALMAHRSAAALGSAVSSCGSSSPAGGLRSSRLRAIRTRTSEFSDACLDVGPLQAHRAASLPAGMRPQSRICKRTWGGAPRTVNTVDEAVFHQPSKGVAKTVEDLGELARAYDEGPAGLASWDQRISHRNDAPPALSFATPRWRARKMVPHNPHHKDEAGDVAELIHMTAHHPHDDLDAIYQDVAGVRTWRRRLPLGSVKPGDSMAQARRRTQVSPQQLSQMDDILLGRDVDKTDAEYLPKYRAEFETCAGLPHWSERRFSTTHANMDKDHLNTFSKKVMTDTIPWLTTADKVVQGRDTDFSGMRSGSSEYIDQFEGAAGARTELWNTAADAYLDGRSVRHSSLQRLRTYRGMHDHAPGVDMVVFNHRRTESSQALRQELLAQRAGLPSTSFNDKNRIPRIQERLRTFLGHSIEPLRVGGARIGEEHPEVDNFFGQPDLAGVHHGPHERLRLPERARNAVSEEARRGQAVDVIHNNTPEIADRHRQRAEAWQASEGSGAAGLGSWSANARNSWDVAPMPAHLQRSAPVIRSKSRIYGCPGQGDRCGQVVFDTEPADVVTHPGTVEAGFGTPSGRNFRQMFSPECAGKRSWSEDPPRQREFLTSEPTEAINYRPPPRAYTSRASMSASGRRTRSQDPIMLSACRPHQYESGGCPEPFRGDPAAATMAAGLANGRPSHGPLDLLRHASAKLAGTPRSHGSFCSSTVASSAPSEHGPLQHGRSHSRSSRIRSMASSVSSLCAAGLPTAEGIAPAIDKMRTVAVEALSSRGSCGDIVADPFAERSGITRRRHTPRVASHSPTRTLSGIL